MLPAPTTIATSTPWSRTAATCRATATTRSGSVPYSSSPISASPESFNRMRLKAGAIAAQPIPPNALLADREAGEAAYHDILPGGCGQLVAQLLHGPAVELRIVHLLLEQHDRRQPRVELARDDFLAHVLRPVGRLLLVDARLGVALVLRDVLAADVLHRRRGRDLYRHLVGEAHEVVVLGDEVGVAVDLDQHAHLRARVHVRLHRALRGRALAQILDFLALLHAQDLDRLLDVSLRLRQRLLAVHHPRARALAQRLHVFCADLHGAHDALASVFVSSLFAGAPAGVSGSAGSATASGCAPSNSWTGALATTSACTASSPRAFGSGSGVGGRSSASAWASASACTASS